MTTDFSFTSIRNLAEAITDVWFELCLKPSNGDFVALAVKRFGPSIKMAVEICYGLVEPGAPTLAEASGIEEAAQELGLACGISQYDWRRLAVWS